MVVQDRERPISGRESLEGVLKPNRLQRLFGFRVRSRSGIEEILDGIGGNLASVLARQGSQRLTASDLGDPRLRRGWTIALVALAPGAQERLLSRIFCVGTGSEEPRCLAQTPRA